MQVNKNNITKVGGYTVKYTNSQEFHIIKSEIFGKQIYNFNSETDSPVIIDCGSHIGLSILFFKGLYHKSIIYGFEPNKFIFPILEENIFINGLKDVEVVNSAVYTYSGVGSLYIDSENQWYSTSAFKKGAWTGTQRTEVLLTTTIDLNKVIEGVLKIEGKIDLLKLDVEGDEVKLIKHIQSKLKDINQILLEYHPIKKDEFNNIVGILGGRFKLITYLQNGAETLKPNLNRLIIIKATE